MNDYLICEHMSGSEMHIYLEIVIPLCFQIRVEKLFFHYVVKSMKIFFHCEILLSLFDTYVSSILNYGCEVWGYHKADDVEKVHISYLKRILKVIQSAVNYMVYCELGRFPMYIVRYCRMLRYWFKLLYNDNCILKCLYEDMFESSVPLKPNDKLNWACRVRDNLFKYGFHNTCIWISQYVNHVDFLYVNLNKE